MRRADFLFDGKLVLKAWGLSVGFADRGPLAVSADCFPFSGGKDVFFYKG